jgi:hypothetical protein
LIKGVKQQKLFVLFNQPKLEEEECIMYKRLLNNNERNRRIAETYFYEYFYGFKEIWGTNPHFSFEDIYYFTVDNREDGLTEVVFYNKNDERLFSELD